MNTRPATALLGCTALLTAGACALPFNDSIEFAADLGSADSLVRQADPRLGTIEDFEAGLGLADPSVPIDDRDGSLWFRWEAPAAGTYHATALDGASLVDIYPDVAGEPGAAVPLAADGFTLSFNASAGAGFFIRHTSSAPVSVGAPPEPVGFLLKRETSGRLTDFGDRRCLSGYLTSFGAGNSESYRWTVPAAGTYTLSLEVFAGGVSAGLERNSVAVPAFQPNQATPLVLAAGDVLELSLSGPAGFATLQFAPQQPGSADLGSVASTVVPLVPGVEWGWTAPVSGYLRIEAETDLPDSGIAVVDALTFDSALARIEDVDTDCETLGFRESVTIPVTAGRGYLIFGFSDFGLGPSGCLSLEFFAAPGNLEQRIHAALAELSRETGAGLAAADAHLAAALAIDATDARANALRALTRLLLLESDPTYTAFLQSLDIIDGGGNVFDPNYAFTEDVDGSPLFPPGADATDRAAAIEALLGPRLAEIRGLLDAASAFNDEQGFLLQVEDSFVLDQADLTALKAGVVLTEALLDLLTTYDLGGALNAYVQLKRDGELDLEHALDEFPGLLKVEDSAEFASFRSRVIDAHTLLCLALVQAQGERVICGRHPFPPRLSPGEAGELLRHFDRLDQLVAVLEGPTEIAGTTIDLSGWGASSDSLRALLPTVRGNRALGFTAPDPTLDGILPGQDQASFNQLLESRDRLLHPAGYPLWIQQFVGVEIPASLAGFLQDGDGDGDTNGAEYFFAANAGDASIQVETPVPDLVPTAGGRRFRVSFVRRIGATDVRYVVAVGEDLNTWDYDEAEVSVVGAPVPVGDGEGEIITVEIAGDLGDARYVRIHAVGQ